MESIQRIAVANKPVPIHAAPNRFVPQPLSDDFYRTHQNQNPTNLNEYITPQMVSWKRKHLVNLPSISAIPNNPLEQAN